jgi:iron complex outermembrane receptor protein/outer membrane receptor for ferrienterochelin and colicins
VGGFASGRGKKIGYTLLALYNRRKPYDVDEDGFTEVPKLNRLTIHPKLFVYLTKHTTLQFGNSFTSGERTGGDIQVIRSKQMQCINILKKIKR